VVTSEATPEVAVSRFPGEGRVRKANSYSQGICDSFGTAGISEALSLFEASNAHRLSLGLRDDNSRVDSSEAQHCGCPKSQDWLRRALRALRAV
jgi:hypothetical protein